MKKALVQNFLRSPNKRLTLMGMSGVGKTHLSKKLPREEWFHYSIDYRIGTRHLSEEISDFLKREAMKQPLLAQLLRRNAISITSNLSFDNLDPLSAYLGMVGDPALGGSDLETFIDRLERHRHAEIAAVEDVPHFVERAERLYGYQNFIVDTSGSFCELEDEKSWKLLGENTLLLYLKASDETRDFVIKRAQTHPKPLYYQAPFLREMIARYLNEQGLQSSREINPQAFARWVFPHLIEHRLELYEDIAQRYGITIDASKLYTIRDQHDFYQLIEEAAYE